MIRLFICVMFFFSVAPVFSLPQNNPQDWAFAALMSIGLMELSRLATQEGRWVGGFSWECHGFFHPKKDQISQRFFSQIGGNETFNEHLLRWWYVDTCVDIMVSYLHGFKMDKIC